MSLKRAPESQLTNHTTKKKKIFLSHVELAMKEIGKQRLSSEESTVVDTIRMHQNALIQSNGTPLNVIPVALQCIHDMISSYFKPHDGTHSLFITPNEYSASHVNDIFEKLLQSAALKPLALSSLLLQHSDVDSNKTKNEINYLARKEKGAVLVSPAKNLPYFIRGKGSSLVNITKLKYVFVLDPQAYVQNEERQRDLSHSLNRLAKSSSGSQFKLIFLTERSLSDKPAQVLQNSLIQNPVSTLADKLSSVHVENIATKNAKSRLVLSYYHQLNQNDSHISTAVTMLKSAMNIPRPTKAVLFCSSKIVLKFVEKMVQELELPLVGSSLNKKTSPKVAAKVLSEYTSAKKGILLATDRFANGMHLYAKTDFFIFVDLPVDVEGFQDLGLSTMTRAAAHKIVLCAHSTSRDTAALLKAHLASASNAPKHFKLSKLNMKQIDTHPTKKVKEILGSVAEADTQLAQKAAVQFFKLHNTRVEKVLDDSADQFKITEEEASQNFAAPFDKSLFEEKNDSADKEE